MNPFGLEKHQDFKAVTFVYLVGLLQGLTLVSFPALSSVLKTALQLTDAQYGTLFLPQVALTALGAIAGGLLVKRLGLTLLLKLSLLANGLSQLALLLGVGMGMDFGFAIVILGTSLLGLGFGLSAAPLNRYPIIFFPAKPDSALAALHTLIGAGLALGPWLVGLLIEMGHWQSFPIGLMMSATGLLLLALIIDFPADNTETTSASEAGKLLHKPTFWLLFVVAVGYAICEGLFSNWAVIFLQEDKHLSPQSAGTTLSAFWAALAVGRLLTAWLVSRLSPTVVWLSFPFLIAIAFLGLPPSVQAVPAFCYMALRA